MSDTGWRETASHLTNMIIPTLAMSSRITFHDSLIIWMWRSLRCGGPASGVPVRLGRHARNRASHFFDFRGIKAKQFRPFTGLERGLRGPGHGGPAGAGQRDCVSSRRERIHLSARRAPRVGRLENPSHLFQVCVCLWGLCVRACVCVRLPCVHVSVCVRACVCGG